LNLIGIQRATEPRYSLRSSLAASATARYRYVPVALHSTGPALRYNVTARNAPSSSVSAFSRILGAQRTIHAFFLYIRHFLSRLQPKDIASREKAYMPFLPRDAL